jgi:hypothetical protein
MKSKAAKLFLEKSFKKTALRLCPVGTEVEHPTHNPKIKGLNLTTGTSRNQMALSNLAFP